MNIIEIQNKSGKVKLTDAVTPWSVEKLTQDIGKLFGASAVANGADFGTVTNAAENGVDTLEIIINSPGGSIFDGYNIYNEIKSLQERGVVVTATVTGMAASMASVICMACDTVRMVPHGRMMIHEASNGVSGNAEAHRKAADLLDGISNDIATIYSNRTKAEVDKIRTLMKAETWMNAKESLAAGFIDEIMNLSSENNSLDVAGINGISEPMSFIDRLISPSDAEAKEKIVALETQISAHDEIVAELQGRLETAEKALQEAAILSTEIAGLKAQVETIPELNQAITDLTEKATITTEKIDAAAATKLAALGHGEPLKIEGTTVTGNEAKTKTRAEIAGMKSAEIKAFIKSGGKITD